MVKGNTADLLEGLSTQANNCVTYQMSYFGKATNFDKHYKKKMPDFDTVCEHARMKL